MERSDGGRTTPLLGETFGVSTASPSSRSFGFSTGAPSGPSASSRADDQGCSAHLYSALDRIFKVQERGSTLKTEFVAGLVNFVANSYLLVLVPQILNNGDLGLDKDAYLVTFVISTSVSSILVGLFSNLPIPAGVGLGCATYFAYSLGDRVVPPLPNITQAQRDQRQQFSSTTSTIAGCVMLCLALPGLPWRLFSLIPQSVKGAMPIGLGLLLALAGFQQMKLVVFSSETGLSVGDPFEGTVLLGLMGVTTACILHHWHWKSSFVIPMLFFTLVAWICNYNDHAMDIHADLPDFSRLPSIMQHLGNTSFNLSIIHSYLDIILPVGSLYIICLFDVGGITYAVSSRAGLVENPRTADEHLPGAHSVFIACAIGTIVSGFLGGSPIIVLGESFAGVIAGGRTGITAIVMGLLFLVSLPLAPLFVSVPTFASAPILVLLGVDLLALVKFLDLDNTTMALPSFFTIALMPYLYSIDKAICFGLGVHIVLQILLALSSPRQTCKRLRESCRERLRRHSELREEMQDTTLQSHHLDPSIALFSSDASGGPNRNEVSTDSASTLATSYAALYQNTDDESIMNSPLFGRRRKSSVQRIVQSDGV